jgi:hypothetical protein
MVSTSTFPTWFSFPTDTTRKFSFIKTVFGKNLNEETMLPEKLFPAIH